VFSYLFKDSFNKITEFKECRSGKIGAYLINLDRARERYSFAMRSLDGLGLPLERISAVDGSNLSDAEIMDVVDVAAYRSYFKMLPERGSIGCSLSHEKAWRKFLESDNEYAIIFEDDVQFDPPELKKVIEFTLENNNLWDLLLLEVIHRGFPIEIVQIGKRRSLVAYLTDVRHSGCYLINRRAAAALLQKFYPIKMPLDHYFTAVWEFDLKLLGVEPRLVHQRFGDSQIKIGDSKKIKDFDTRIDSATYIVKRSIINFLYNCIVAANLKKSILLGCRKRKRR
jgi:glycosyl transferase family 25